MFNVSLYFKLCMFYKVCLKSFTPSMCSTKCPNQLCLSHMWIDVNCQGSKSSIYALLWRRIRNLGYVFQKLVVFHYIWSFLATKVYQYWSYCVNIEVWFSFILQKSIIVDLIFVCLAKILVLIQQRDVMTLKGLKVMWFY